MSRRSLGLGSLPGRLRACAAALTVSLIGVVATGCATVGEPTTRQPDSISGRMSVRVDAIGEQPVRSVSASFELQGTPETGLLNLSSPLGTVLAQARWSPQQVHLSTSEGDTLFPNLDALTQEVLGESLPVAALFDWLHGRPWPQASSVINTPPAANGFAQLGWSVDLSRFAEGWVVAERTQAPKVTVRARVEP
ncbi:MAG: hypothetical protein RLZZ618_2300 [Pseudomonadota bacterium]